MHIYTICGLWELGATTGWFFLADGKGGRLLLVESNSTLDELKRMVLEDFGMEEEIIADLELSYLPAEWINTSGCPPVIIANDRQLHNFVRFVQKSASTRLCVTCKAKAENPNKEAFDLNKPPADPCTHEEKENLFDSGGEPAPVYAETQGKKKNEKRKGVAVDEDGDYDADTMISEKENIHKMSKFSLLHVVKVGQFFENKTLLKATFEMCAMKHNFDYQVIKTDRQLWYVRCADNACDWGVRAECLKDSTYFMIKKYVGKHTCAPSSKTKAGKTASAKTIGSLIMHKYVGVKEGPKCNDIIQIMRSDHGCEISKSLAWDAREYAISAVRGIPERSYGKIPKYLHMLREANPGTHTSYEIDGNENFRYLFIAFGQSIRGFNRVMRRVIVIDGTFLKNKYKGVLLVATALDGNSNLYPIAFGIVDSENERSWEWFMRELKVVIADDHDLAFISDRHGSIAKAIENVYPSARHGICIHHLLNNVVTYFHGKGLAGLVSKASKAYRVSEFEKTFASVCNISPAIGDYLREADVQKWARCKFPGYRYDIRTTNPAESINSALRSPREYPVIPLLDSIREMLTRWFYERKKLSSNHKHPLTKDVEKKIDRRIGKGSTFVVYPVSAGRLLVRGDKFDCLVDLDRRTCSCGKYNLMKIPCRHAIKAGFHVGREPHTLTDLMYTTGAWREAYEESINPIDVPEDAWSIPEDVKEVIVLPPETRRSVGRKRKRRYETAEDKIRSSQMSRRKQPRKCSRCGISGHNRATCQVPI
ncbi:uncharacterized protein LOC117126649 [Brassica rapa]|uniref:uncharacterized protein LOC117126649 n=1 Tax=Brassica campestris TaxID=3711 RepID=UPI00142E7AF0|nr:uncharacterized protein LOC117126649 [Brassica rapa]